MAISQSFENSNDLGELKPGWSINIAATPHIIGESAGGTGSVSSQYSAREDSLFTINDSVTTIYNDGLSSKFISGTVKSVSQTGNDVSISHSTQLDKYDADYNIPPLTVGGTYPVTDIATTLVGESGLSSEYFGYNYPGHATSLCGHSNFFDMDHKRIIGESKTTSYTYYNPTTGKYQTVSVDYLRNAVWADNYILVANSYVYADGVIGDSFSPVYAEANVEHIAYKFILQDEVDEFGTPTGNLLGHSWGFSGNPIDNDFDYGFDCSIVVSPTTNQIVVGFDLTEGGTPVEYKKTIDAVFNPGVEYVLYARFSYGKDTDGSSRTRFYLDGYITDSYQSVNAPFSETISLYVAPTWYAAWGINGLARHLWRYSEFVEMPEPLIVATKYNFIENNDFETDTSGWSVTAGFGATGYVLTRVANTGNFPHGSWSAQTTATAASSGSWYKLAYNIKNLSRASEISDDLQIFSFYAKNTNSINPSTVEVIFYDNFGNPLNSSVWGLSDTWDRYSLSFNADSSVTELFLEINIYATNAGSYGMVFDAVQLENYSLQLDLGLTDFWNASMGTYGNTSRQFITRNGQTYSKEVYLANPLDMTQFNELGYGYYYKNYFPGSTENMLSNPVPGVKMNLWEYLQNAMSAYNCEIKALDNSFTVFDMQSYSSGSLSNLIQIPSVTPTSTFSGNSIDIVYNNSEVVNGTEVYDAYDDGNKVISVKSKETVNVTINTNSSLNTVLQPKRKFSLPNAEGYFIVSDSTGVPVGGTNTNTAWEDYGGKVSVAINPDIPGALDVTVTGPFQEIPAYPGPYKLAYSDGSNDYAALSILGNGVKVDNKTLNLQTGAVRAKTKQEVAKTITNPFISTLEQAYDRGIWASSDAAGPKVSLSASMQPIANYASNAGTVREYGYGSYRIMDCSTSVISESINAQRYVTVSAFIAKWAGKTVAYHDGVWASNKIQDQIIQPFKKLDIVSGYMTDTDGIFLVIDGSTPGSLVLKFDTDGTPYYSNLNMTDEPTLIYLDTDFTPYYV